MHWLLIICFIGSNGWITSIAMDKFTSQQECNTVGSLIHSKDSQWEFPHQRTEYTCTEIK